MRPRLKFRNDQTFTIVQFTDVHWKNGDEKDMRSRRLMEAVLEAERPDLAVFTGDVIDSVHCRDPKRSFVQAVEAVERHGIPWAAVFGNHDAEEGVTREELMTVMADCRYSLAEPGPAGVTGVGNYAVPVFGAKRDEPAARLYFLDSGSYAPENIGGYGWITLEQTNWYMRESQRNAKRVPALAFFHIPLPEYDDVWRTQTCYGFKHEPVCCPKINTGFYSALLARGEVIATFAGHDHVNDYYGDLYGIRLYYGRSTGYNTYGKEGFRRGARVIRLRENMRSPDSWIRLDDGTVIANQPMHRPV